MELFACVMLVCIWLRVNGSLRRKVLLHPNAQGTQMAYATSRWLFRVVILWWVVILIPILADRYLPDDVFIDFDGGQPFQLNNNRITFSSATVLE